MQSNDESLKLGKAEKSLTANFAHLTDNIMILSNDIDTPVSTNNPLPGKALSFCPSCNCNTYSGCIYKLGLTIASCFTCGNSTSGLPGGGKGNNNKKMEQKSSSNRTRSSRTMFNGHPKQIRNIPILHHTFRFQATAGQAQSITITSLNVLGALGSICTVNNSTVACMAQSFRIKRLKVYGAVGTLGQGNTVIIDWAGTTQTPNIEVSDSSTSSAYPAYVSSAPPRESNASFWQTPQISSTIMFAIACAPGSIIDLEVEYTLADVDSQFTSCAVITVAAGTLSVPYYLSLDGNTTHNLIPTGLNTTF
jgi:hypothetical protein